MGGTDRSPPAVDAIAAVAVDHVLLSYLYLDEGNLDGYASLLAEDARLARPDLPLAVGRDSVVAQLARFAGPPARHRLYRVIASVDGVAAEGCCRCPDAMSKADGFHFVDFVDIVTFSADGLLLGQRRYYDTSST